MIHVCFGLHDADGRYSKFTGTTILSMFENANTPPPSTTIHILHDNTLTRDNREKFIYLAGRYGQIVRFYNVEKLCADKISEFLELIPAVKTSKFTVGTMYRLLIPQLLPELDKVIYLDSDIIFNLDIAELWRVELEGKPLAAMPEILVETKEDTFKLCTSGIVEYENYFNAGILLLNLKRLRQLEEVILDGVIFYGENPQLIYFDQDILNYCFSEDYLKLPLKFNAFVKYARKKNLPLGRNIYHYADGKKAFGLNMNDAFHRLWMHYFMKTPWFDEDTIGHLYESMRQLYVDSKTSLVHLSAMMSGKTRAFVILPPNLEATKQIFMVRDDEEIISIGEGNALPEILDAMTRGLGKKIFFVLLPNFPFGALTEAGFVYGRDFLNAFELLSEAHGLPQMNSYSIVKNL